MRLRWPNEAPARPSSHWGVCSPTRVGSGSLRSPWSLLSWLKNRHANVSRFSTLPGVRAFFVDGVRNGASSNGFTGVNEVKFRNGRIVREGLKTTLSELRLAKRHRSARARWDANVGAPSIFVISRERAKLGYFWRHVYGTPHSGPFHGGVVNPDTGKPILTSDDQLRRADFRKVKHSELILPGLLLIGHDEGEASFL